MKKIIAFLLICSAFQSYAYDLDPVLATEANEMLTPGLRSTLKISLKINSIYFQDIKLLNICTGVVVTISLILIWGIFRSEK